MLGAAVFTLGLDELAELGTELGAGSSDGIGVGASTLGLELGRPREVGKEVGLASITVGAIVGFFVGAGDCLGVPGLGGRLRMTEFSKK